MWFAFLLVVLVLSLVFLLARLVLLAVGHGSRAPAGDLEPYLLPVLLLVVLLGLGNTTHMFVLTLTRDIDIDNDSDNGVSS